MTMPIQAAAGTRCVRSLAALAAAATAAAAFASAAPATTGAELVIPMRVTLTDRGIHFSAVPHVDLDTTILFLVTNKSTQRRWFEVGSSRTTTRRTRVLRRGAVDRFYYVFRVRGKVRFRSGGPGARLRTGTFRVV